MNLLSAERNVRRKSQYMEVSNNHYNAFHWFYGKLLPQGINAPGGFYVGESYEEGQARAPHYLALKLQLTREKHCLDIGCGYGAPTRRISGLVGCRITGLNINSRQLMRCEELTAVDPLMRARCEYVKGDFCHMPFADATFDAAYAIESTAYSPEICTVLERANSDQNIFRIRTGPIQSSTRNNWYQGIRLMEAFRVLKPGGLYAAYETLLTDKYDESNRLHVELKERFENLVGIPSLVETFATIKKKALNVGFEFLETRDYMEELPVKYYDLLTIERIMYPKWLGLLINSLSGNTKVIVNKFLVRICILFISMPLKLMEIFGSIPDGSYRALKMAMEDSRGVESSGNHMSRIGIMNTHFFYLLRKPSPKKNG